MTVWTSTDSLPGLGTTSSNKQQDGEDRKLDYWCLSPLPEGNLSTAGCAGPQPSLKTLPTPLTASFLCCLSGKHEYLLQDAQQFCLVFSHKW